MSTSRRPDHRSDQLGFWSAAGAGTGGLRLAAQHHGSVAPPIASRGRGDGRFHTAQRLPAHPCTTDAPLSDSHRPKARRAGLRRGVERRDPSVSADVPLNECGQPVFDAGNRSRAVLVVLFIAQQGGQCGGVGELLPSEATSLTVRSSKLSTASSSSDSPPARTRARCNAVPVLRAPFRVAICSA